MSTHIYHAFRFKHSEYVLALEQLEAQRTRARRVQNDFLAAKFASKILFKLVNHFRYGHELGSPTSDVWREYNASRNQQDRLYKNRQWDSQLDVMLYRITCPETHEVVLLGKALLGQNDFYGRMFARNRSLPIQDYHYQDSTDKPDSISYPKWRLRRKQWEEALPGLGAPMDSGVMVRLGWSDPPWPEVSDILRHMIVEDVVEKYSRKHVVNDHVSAVIAAEGSSKNSASVSQLMRAMDKTNAWMETHEGKEALAEEAARLWKVLPERFTKEHI